MKSKPCQTILHSLLIPTKHREFLKQDELQITEAALVLKIYDYPRGKMVLSCLLGITPHYLPSLFSQGGWRYGLLHLTIQICKKEYLANMQPP